MSNQASVKGMAAPPRPVLILFMGKNDGHAITSFQHFFPASVHIVTSDRFSDKYEEMLTEWSDSYGFRRGTVNSVDDLFEPTAVNSLIAASCGALREEFEHGGESEEKGPLLVGITGGTMHMAVSGTYFAQLAGGTAFYVLRPPEGQPVIPARDVVVFPELRSLRTALTTTIPDIHYLIGEGEGEVEKLFEESEINGYWLDKLESEGLIEIEENKWQLTDLGHHSFSFITSSRMWNDVHTIFESMATESEKSPDDNLMHG